MRCLPLWIWFLFVVLNGVKGYIPFAFSGWNRAVTSVRAAQLLPDPLPYAIGESMSFIQCYMVSLGAIDDKQYGVGVPVDTPVMLTYFEDYTDYDHLVNHVAVQMDSNEFQLYRTPVVLTLQGELDDEEDSDEGDDSEGEDEEEYTLDELLAMEDDTYDDEDEDDDDDDSAESADEDEDEDDDDGEDDDSNTSMSSFWASSPSGKIDEKYNKIPDYSLFRSPSTDSPTPIPANAVVTEEDTKELKKAHRKADRIIQYAADMTLIASFHYAKKNYHLVRLLEPILIIGKRVTDIKGYYFTLLNDNETSTVRPILEELMLSTKNKKSKNTVLSSDSSADVSKKSGSESDAGRRTSRRRWANRKGK